jgi:prepilin-type N-terminal cleavage/methylation domain-containing protein
MIINGLHKNGNIRGFTLLELLIAMTFLVTGLLAAANMQGVAMNANSSANRISVATMVGQQVAEDLCSLKITDTLLHTSVTNATYNRLFDPATKTSTAGAVFMPGAGTFSAQYDIAPNTPMTGTTQITVRVFYDGSTTPVVSFSTFKMVT